MSVEACEQSTPRISSSARRLGEKSRAGEVTVETRKQRITTPPHIKADEIKGRQSKGITRSDMSSYFFWSWLFSSSRALISFLRLWDCTPDNLSFSCLISNSDILLSQ